MMTFYSTETRERSQRDQMAAAQERIAELQEVSIQMMRTAQAMRAALLAAREFIAAERQSFIECNTDPTTHQLDPDDFDHAEHITALLAQIDAATGKGESRSDLQPTRGLTLSKSTREVNVHDVFGGEVFFGLYRNGEELPARLSRTTVQDFTRQMNEALAEGAVAYTNLRQHPRCQETGASHD